MTNQANQSTNETNVINITADYAVNLSIIEVGLGSILHGFKIPFGGHILSLNQGVFLSHAVAKLKNFENKSIAHTCFNISSISAVLKSLSPAGNKLGPMLSISMQGILYSLGLILFGANIIGVCLGMSLLSLWAFVQPFITLYFFFGNSLIEGMHFYSDKMSRSLQINLSDQISIFIGIILVKAIIGIILGVYFYYSPNLDYFTLPKRTLSKKNIIPKYNRHLGNTEIASLALKDLMKPMFIFSMILFFIFLFFSVHEYSQMIWLGLRPIALAFLFFFISRHPILFKVFSYMRKRQRFEKFSQTFEKTIKKINAKESE